MIGLIKKDLLSGYRRVSPFSNIFVIVVDVALVLFLRNVYSLITIALVSMPVQMAGLVTTLKEIDMNSTGETYTLTLPYSWKDYVRGRYMAVMIDGMVQSMIGLVLVILHFFLNRLYAFPMYMLYWVAGVLMGLIFIFINAMGAFMGGLNASAVVYLITICFMVGGFLAFAFLDIDYQAILHIPPLFLWGGSIALCLCVGLLSYFVSITVMGRRRRK